MRVMPTRYSDRVCRGELGLHRIGTTMPRKPCVQPLVKVSWATSETQMTLHALSRRCSRLLPQRGDLPLETLDDARDIL